MVDAIIQNVRRPGSFRGGLALVALCGACRRELLELRRMPKPGERPELVNCKSNRCGALNEFKPPALTDRGLS